MEEQKRNAERNIALGEQQCEELEAQLKEDPTLLKKTEKMRSKLQRQRNAVSVLQVSEKGVGQVRIQHALPLGLPSPAFQC